MRLEKGDAFGELALLYDSVRSATIVTDEPTELIVLNKESFRKHIRVGLFLLRRFENMIDDINYTFESNHGVFQGFPCIPNSSNE